MTYIASLLAFHQIDRGKRVAVVTCRNFLVTQFNRKLGDLRRMRSYGASCRDGLELAIVRLVLVNNAVVRRLREG